MSGPSGDEDVEATPSLLHEASRVSHALAEAAAEGKLVVENVLGAAQRASEANHATLAGGIGGVGAAIIVGSLGASVMLTGGASLFGLLTGVYIARTAERRRDHLLAEERAVHERRERAVQSAVRRVRMLREEGAPEHLIEREWSHAALPERHAAARENVRQSSLPAPHDELKQLPSGARSSGPLSESTTPD